MWRRAMQKDRDVLFCEGVSPKIVRGTGRIFGAGKRGRKLMQKAQNSGGVFANGVAILEFGPGRVSSGQGQARLIPALVDLDGDHGLLVADQAAEEISQNF